ncbi:MAG: hypothetical protein JNL24_01495 [Bacteroidia bacterium]|nr:hypothetical protein [Bacteroidia bacterium]
METFFQKKVSMGIILYICLMVTKAYQIIRLISLVLLLLVASYFEAPAAVMEGVEDYAVQTTVVRAMGDLELKAILEPFIEIGNLNTSFRIGSGIKKEGWSTFYDLSSGNERQLYGGKTVFSSFHHHTPLYISYRSILI